MPDRRIELTAPVDLDQLACSACSWRAAAKPELWGCPECSAPVEFALRADIQLDQTALSGEGLARYAAWLGFGAEHLLTLGEVRTPLLRPSSPPGTLLKSETVMPTGSFKDRGAATLVSWLAERGTARIVVDSSGNAGAALAAYAARAGIACEVHIPSDASPVKSRQACAYGASVVLHPGPRAASTTGAQRAAQEASAVYASQLWHPAFLLGIETLAFELWEQYDRSTPDTIVVPVGAGSLLLGIERGLRALIAAGLLIEMPRLIGVQSSSCTAIAAHFGDAGVNGTARRSIAEGIQVADPPRLRQIIDAIAGSGGTALCVDDTAIRADQHALAREGVLVEPTAAVALAGLKLARERDLLDPEERAVAVLTGTGLKTIYDPQ
jgi:threonine synthase